MTLEKATEGHWDAYGRGPIRYITVEAETRREAARAFAAVWREQMLEVGRMERWMES